MTDCKHDWNCDKCDAMAAMLIDEKQKRLAILDELEKLAREHETYEFHWIFDWIAQKRKGIEKE